MRIRSDVRQAVRSLRRSPWYASTAIAITAVGVVMMATVFAVADGVLFRSLPYANPQDIFAVSGRFAGETGPPPRLVGTVSPREVNAWRAAVPDVPITLLGYSSIVLEDGSFATTATVDREFVGVFGVRLLVGGFTDADFTAGESIRPIVISHRLWRSHFNGDPQIVGRVFTPHGFRTTPYRIAGVLHPDGFVPPLPGEASSWVQRRSRVDALTPLALPPTFGERIGVGFVRASRPGAAATEAALRSAVVGYQSTVPPPGRPYLSEGQRRAMAPYDDVSLVPLEKFVTARQRPILAIVFATASGLMLLVLLNAGALAVARLQERRREVAVRRSLGAGPRDLLRSALLEQGLLAAAGALLGLALAPSLLHLVEAALPPGLELIKSVRIDWRAVAFVTFISAALTVTIALMNVRYAVRLAALNPLLGETAVGGRAGSRSGRLLVAAQVALGFVLVLGGALFVRSIGLVWSEEPGFRVRDAALLRVSRSELVERSRTQHLIAGVRAVPGVAAAGAFDASILTNFRGDSPFRGPDGGPPPAPAPSVLQVGSGFFAASGMTVVSGRLPSEAELDSGAPVIAVSELVAARYWPGQEPIGRTLRRGSAESRVVGVVGDARLVAMDVAPSGTIFAPLPARSAGMWVFAALADQPEAVLARLVARVPEIDPIARVSEAKTVEDAAVESVQPRRISALAASGFALGSLIVIGVGLFGLTAQTTVWRRRELGIRLALGDTPAGIIRLVAARHAVTVACGLLSGSLLAAAAVRPIAGYLYGVTAYDAWIWLLSGSVVLAAATAGAVLPALRAGAISPLESLRAE